MFKIAVCDDSEYMRKETCRYILNYSFKKDFDYKLDEYDTGEKLLASDEKYDLIFMDYQFEGIGSNGITIAKELRKKECEAVIIFLSSYPGVVFESFEVGTFRFLVKPVEEEKFDDALDSFVQSMEEEDVLAIRVDGINHFIKESKILYVEGYGKHCIIHFSSSKNFIECHETMSSVEERLSTKYFYRCFKSFVVNLKHVTGYSHTDVILDNGESILISRTKYKEFTEVYSSFLAGQRR